MRIFDCFTFFNEFDLLDIRLGELGGVVDRFILVEADRTHTGAPKPLYFQEARHRYARHGDRIAAFIVDDMPPIVGGDPWPLERHQRARTGSFLASLGCADDDVILLSDVDEIPRASSLPAALEMVRRRRFAVFIQTLYRFYLNNVTRDDEHLCGWCGTVAFRYAELATHNAERIRGRWCNGGQFYRHASWSRRRRCIADAGWHFTSMGGPRVLQYKFQSFAHPEIRDPADPPVERAVMHGVAGSAEEEPCRVFRGTCACGCRWKERTQQYALPGSPSFAGVLDALPGYVQEHRDELAGLFRNRPVRGSIRA